MPKNTNLVNGGAMLKNDHFAVMTHGRRHFSGRSDARIIMGKNEKALSRLWREKRGEKEAPDLSAALIVQPSLVTEDVNHRSDDETMDHGISARRSKSGAVSFDLVEMEASHASIQ
jgi:hypothetical protein